MYFFPRVYLEKKYTKPKKKTFKPLYSFLGIVSTLAGTGASGFLDGPSSLAQFNMLTDVCDDGLGNVFVADSGNNRIRLININTEEGLNYF